MSETVASPGGARFEWANMLRGVAALSVVVFHFGVVFWMSQDVGASLARRAPLYPRGTGAPAFARGLTLLHVDLGAFGVGLFFILSGFVIAVSVDRYSRGGFVVGRLFRIVPTYAAGYVVTCAVVFAMSDPAGELGVLRVLVGCIPGLGLLLGVPTPGDGVVWTLVIEMVFYGVCLVVYRRLTRGWVASILVASACAVAQVVLARIRPTGGPWDGTVYILELATPFIPLMLVGVLLSGKRRGQLRTRVVAVVPVLIAVHTVLLHVSPIFHPDVSYHVGCLLAVALFVLGWWTGGRWRRSHVTDALADVSYPLYVVHPVLGYALLSVLTSRGLNPAFAVLAATAVALGAAFALHRVVEVPTHRWGRRLARRLTPPLEPVRPVDESTVAPEVKPSAAPTP